MTPEEIPLEEDSVSIGKGDYIQCSVSGRRKWPCNSGTLQSGE